MDNDDKFHLAFIGMLLLFFAFLAYVTSTAEVAKAKSGAHDCPSEAGVERGFRLESKENP